MSVPFVHVSSGCIYDGYDKAWNEFDDPNFGMFHKSSFYSKTKHAFELVSAQLPGTILRIRMPFGDDLNDRSLLTKLLKYDRLIDMKNSKTSVIDLSNSILHMITMGMLDASKRKTYHMVNPKPLMTSDVVREMRAVGIYNPNWSFVPVEQIPIVAPRSNCVIETIHNDNPFLHVEEELMVLRKHLKIMKGTI
jgi:dTDP-4-dehydrorhamnose reductase